MFMFRAAGYLGADTMHIDFNNDLTNATEWVYSGGASVISKGALSLKNSAALASPHFQGIAITNITLYAALASASSRPQIVLYPYSATAGELDAIAITGADRSIVSNLAWDASERISGFTVESHKASGAFHLYSMDIAYLSATPQNLEAELYLDAITASWQSDWQLEATFLRLCKIEGENIEDPALEGWDFADVVSPSGSVTPLENAFFDEFAGLDGENCRYPGNSYDGSIQVGTTSLGGCVIIESVPEGAVALEMRAYVRNEKNGTKIPVLAVTGGETNTVGTLTLAAEPQTVTLALDGVAAGSELIISTAAAKKNNFGVCSIKLKAEEQDETSVTEIASRRCGPNTRRVRLRTAGSGKYRLEAWAELPGGYITPKTMLDISITDKMPRLFKRGMTISIR